MTTDSFDLKSLQSRIEMIKEEGKEVTDFTHEYLTFLIDRYGLEDYVPDNCELEDVPEIIIEKILKGEVPSKDEILLMDSDVQNYFLFEMIYLCGMGVIARFDYNNDPDPNNPGLFDAILEMRDMSPAHFMGGYITAVLTLLMGCIPSFPIIELLTNNFSCEEEQLEQNMLTFSELAASLIGKYREDQEFWSD